MSGQLVGEVLAASESLRARGLSPRAFHALVAIAEKAETHTRQGSVRWDHICAAIYGASLSTAKRAVFDLKAAGIIRVIKRGFNNQNGRSAAPVYEIAPLSEQITQVTQSSDNPTGHLDEPFAPDRTGHPGDPIAGGRTGHIDDRTGHIDDRTGHPDDLLDVSIDGSTDGGGARDREGPRPEHKPSEPFSGLTRKRPVAWVRGPYGPRCSAHIDHPDPPKCIPCKQARLADEDEQEQARLRRVEIRAAIDACHDCDAVGKRDDLSICPKHPNFLRQKATTP